MIDSHCHLDYYSPEEREGIIKNAFEAGLTCMQTICTRVSEFPKILEIARSDARIYASLGTHPDGAHEEQVSAAELIRRVAESDGKVIGIGETGLDYYHTIEHKALQQKAFREHISAAQKLGLPIIVHTRAADEDTLAMLREALGEAPLKILMHCFTGGVKFAEELLDLGAFISYSGIVTFKNAREVHESMMFTPLDRLLIETDAPFLAPVPMRGKRNEPAFLPFTARFIAEARALAPEELARLTTQNFTHLFGVNLFDVNIPN